MPVLVMLVLVTVVAQCWSAPQRRNWTPQAILYLKGAQGHRSALERHSREEGDTSHSVSHARNGDGLSSSLLSLLLELLRPPVEEGRGNPELYPDEQELDLIYF